MEYDSGEVRSTPFHVRFGKFKVRVARAGGSFSAPAPCLLARAQVFRSRDKVVKLFVNDEEIKDVDIRVRAACHLPNSRARRLVHAATPSKRSWVTRARRTSSTHRTRTRRR